MINAVLPYRIFSLGDSAITIDFGNCIDEAINQEVIARFHQLQQQPLPGILEAIPAYSSLTIYYDVVVLKKKMPAGHTVLEWMEKKIEEILQQPFQKIEVKERLIKIPVCYEDEFAVDIRQLAAIKKISVQEVVQIHTAKSYKVYMLGFLPGFAYMGEVDEKITIPRKSQPVNIAKGSVGIAGKQTGIYPLASPGGWQIIGRTPVNLFKAPLNLPEVEAFEESENLEIPDNSPTLLKAGDIVQFYSITRNDFYEIQNSRLSQKLRI